MNARLRFAFLFFFVAAQSIAGPAPLHAEAERMLARLKSSVYQHETLVDERKGDFRFDCSGFVGYAASRRAPNAWDELRGWVDEAFVSHPRRPLAKHFVAFFAALASGDARAPHWRSVLDARRLRAGDVIAWRMPADVESVNTGHVMIVEWSLGPSQENAGDWLVTVIDSTSSGHGRADPRKKNGPNGLGRGIIALTLDGTGTPLGYRWNGLKGKVAHETEVRIGRVREQ